MALNNLFQGETNITFEENKEIRITKRTVSFGSDVYQFRNIVGFSEGTVKMGNLIPYSVIVLVFVIGLVLSNISRSSQGIGILLILFSIGGIVINVMQQKKYGLLLTLNSGDKHLFITSDSINLKEVVTQLYNFMEADQEGMYVVTVNDNSIRINGNLTGVASAGNQQTNISANIR